MRSMIVLLSALFIRCVLGIADARRTPFPLFGLAHVTEVHDSRAPLLNRIIEDTLSHAELPSDIKVGWFEQRLDHFNHTSDETFPMRYWISDRHYQEGGPIIALLAGETSGENRIGFLDYGIIDILARATNGMGVLLEHRYYGESIPVKDFSTKNLRWLNTALALEDNVHFSRNVDLGFGNATHSRNAPWIWYGGSYAGGQAAFLRSTYPEDVYGAIASSGAVHAQVNFWEYFEPIRLNGGDCARQLIKVIEHIDNILFMNDPAMSTALKDIFGLADLEDDRDFTNVLTWPLSFWQERQWTEGNNDFEAFCNELTSNVDVTEASPKQMARLVANYAVWIRDNVTSLCYQDGASWSMNDCFASSSQVMSDRLNKFDLKQTWRLWQYQVCTEWGYFMPAAPPGILSLISRRLDLDYASSICRVAFHDLPSAIPAWPAVENIGKFGDFGLEAERLMLVDGSADPWLYACAHSPYAPSRRDSLEKPFKLIPGGYHHSDEYGVRNKSTISVPKPIQEIHKQEVEVVLGWLREWTLRAPSGAKDMKSGL